MSSPPSTDPAPPPSPPIATRPSRSSYLLMAAVIAVALAVVFASVAVLGYLAAQHSPTPLTYRSAAASVMDYLTTAFGGPWTIESASAMAPPHAFSEPFYANFGPGESMPGCRETAFLRNGTLLTVPGDGQAAASGTATLWGFAAEGPTGFVTVFDLAGPVVPIEQFSCGGGASYPPVTAVPSGVIDSHDAASIAGAAGMSAFAAAHPGGTTSLAITPEWVSPAPVGHSTFPSAWWVSYQACSPTGNSSSEPVIVPSFNATIDADTGHLLGASTVMASCDFSNLFGAPTTPIGQALSLGGPVLSQGAAGSLPPPCLAGDYCYTIPIRSAASGLTPTDIGVQVEGGVGGGPIHLVGAGGASFVDASGQAMVSQAIPAIPQGQAFVVVGWEPDGTFTTTNIQLDSSMSLVLDLSTFDPAGQGLVVTLSGYGAFSGQFSETLP